MMTDQDREEMKMLIQETLVEVLKTHHDREDMRSLIRETLAEFLTPATSSLPSFVAEYPEVRPADTGNPFLMNDAELRFAERLLAEPERPILRMRVMAARLDSRGQRNAASNMRSRADNKERQLGRLNCPK